MGEKTLRDEFAMAALEGFLADGSQRLIAQALEEDPNRALIQDALALASVVNEQLAAGCYALADAMLRARALQRREDETGDGR